jgi:hypothetical protein
MTDTVIDVWDIATFDDGLLAHLRAKAELVRNYMVTERNNFLEYTTSKRWQPLKPNSFSAAYQDFVERTIMSDMEDRTIRAWHYARLTDAEAELLNAGGIYLSTLDTIRSRLDMQTSDGLLSTEAAAALYAASPFHHQNESRSKKFWMTSHPHAVDDSGVTLLLEHWGGEGVYFWLKDAGLIKLVKGIGKPRVIEIAVPLNATNHAYGAASAVMAAFAQTLGCKADRAAFDLYSTRDLGPASVLKIHTDGEPTFRALARGYPATFARTPDI